jgi:hypothetical protein
MPKADGEDTFHRHHKPPTQNTFVSRNGQQKYLRAKVTADEEKLDTDKGRTDSVLDICGRWRYSSWKMVLQGCHCSKGGST